MAKHFLNTNDEDFEFVLIGIISAENQYSMISRINDALGINLYLSDYIPFHLKESRLFKFSLFRFVDEELNLEYCFIPNTSNFDEPSTNTANQNDLFSGLDIDESTKLIKELPKTNYFLILKGESLHTYEHKIMDRLKNIPEIIQLQAIEPNELPSRRNLIF